MDAWEAYAVDAAEERGDQPSEDAISNALGSLADSASQWISPEGLDRAVEKAAAAADGLRQKGLDAATQGLAAAKDKAKLFEKMQANDPLLAAGGEPAAPVAEPDAAPTTNGDDAHKRELTRVKEQSLRDARRVEGEQLRENQRLSEHVAELQRAVKEANAKASTHARELSDVRDRERRAAGNAQRFREEAEALRAAQRASAEALASARDDAQRADARAAQASTETDRAQRELRRTAHSAEFEQEGRADLAAKVDRSRGEAARASAAALRHRDDLAAAHAEVAQLLHRVEAEARSRRDAEQKLRRLAHKRPPPAAPPAPAPETVVVEVDESQIRALREELAAARAKAARAEQREADGQRRMRVLEAAASKVRAEAAAADSEARRYRDGDSDLRRRCEAAERAATSATAAREEALADVDARVDAAKAAGERVAAAAKRQVAALDKALSGRDALVACTEARGAMALRDTARELEDARKALGVAESRTQAARRSKAFLFGGAVRDELSRLQRQNDRLREEVLAGGGEQDDAAAPPPRKPAPRVTRPGDDGFDAKTRATYAALAVSQLCAAAGAGEKSRAATVAPVLSELLKQPHNAVRHWLAALERDPESAAATCAALDLLRDALDEGAERERAAASLGAQRALRRYDARLAAAAVLSAARDNAARTREDTRTRGAAQRMCAAADAAVADAVKRVEAADHARDNAVQKAAELQRAVTESGASPEFAHARAACVAVLRSGRGSSAYNKLLPLLRGFLRVPHAVVEDNVLALLGTGSGADFVEALTAPPPENERSPS